MKRRLLCLLLTILLLAQLVPSVSFAEEAEVGSFVFAAAKAGQVVISPTRFGYTEGQTIHDVLMTGDHGHSFLEPSSGFINVIDGVEGSYSRFDDHGGFDMDVPAASVSAFFFVSSDLELTEESAGTFSTMLTAMADYNAADNGLHAYAPAVSAYQQSENALLGAAGDYAALALALRAAMTEYEETVLDAAALPLALRFENLEGGLLTEYTFTADDSYGNTYVFHETDDTVALPAREYYFTLTAGINSARGTMTVDDTGAVSVGGTVTDRICLHDGDPWMGDVVLHSTSGGDAVADAYPMVNDTYYIPDNHDMTYLWIDKGAGLDDGSFTTSNVMVFPIYRQTNGVEKKGEEIYEKRSWRSRYDALPMAVSKGTEGNSILLEARAEWNGYTLVESRPITLVRTPTLAALTVLSDGASQNIGFAPEAENYTFSVSSESIVIEPRLRQGDYTVTVAGKPLINGRAEIALADGQTTIPVNVMLNGESKIYTLQVERVSAVEVTVIAGEDFSVQVFNTAGAEMGGRDGRYALVPNETYTCVSTKDTYYHAAVDFTAAAGLTVMAPEPQTEDWLQALALRSGTRAATSTVYLASDSFAADRHDYIAIVPDGQSNLYAGVMLAQGCTAAVVETGAALSGRTNVDTGATVIRNFLQKGPDVRQLTIRVEKTETSGVRQYQDYSVELRRSLSVTDLTLTVEGEAQTIYPEGTGYPGYDSEYDRYTADIVRAAQAAELIVTPYHNSYYVTVNDTRYDLPVDSKAAGETIRIPLQLNTSADEETVTVAVCCDAEGTVSDSCTVILRKRDAVHTEVRITDGTTGEAVTGALAAVYDSLGGDRIWPDADGTFPLVDTLNYRVVCTCYGYVGQTFELTAAADGTVRSVSLVRAPEQAVRTELGSSWPSFRGSDDANGVVDFRTPVQADNAVLSWANKLGEGYSSSAVSCPILITENGYEYLIVYASNRIFKVDAVSGVTVAEGMMDHSSSFAINSPTYAEGMLFVGLAGGTVQAFDAATLESLWIYRDPRGGQPNCPITYSNGYIYTGFWIGETTPANFVCLSVTDEDPTRGDEQKLAAWTHTDNGFYWAGSYVSPEQSFLLVGTDDGNSDYLGYTARLLCLDPADGKLLDTIDGIRGDLRSNVSYDSATDRYFFTSKGGYFYSTKMTETDGVPCFDRASFRSVYLDNYGNDPSRPPMSTCTPVVYNGRAYIGVSGVGQFTAYSGHNITVIDLNTWKIAYSVPTQGYPQTSGLLTTAYEEESGYVFVYFFDNFTPGKLRVLQDRAGQTAPVVTTPETYSDKGQETLYNTPYVLFTPSGDQAQYAICSPISDAFGTIYFKNDSACLMALTNTVTAMEVVKQPDKTEYTVGEHFDPTGMEIELTYSNGMKRTLPYSRTVNGVTIEYFTWDDRAEGLRVSDSEFFVRFKACMYQDDVDAETGTDTPGKPLAAPEAVLQLTITAPAGLAGDVNGDGEVDMQDLTMVIWYVNEATGVELTPAQLAAADVNGDGEVDITDVSYFIWYVNETISSFPNGE